MSRMKQNERFHMEELNYITSQDQKHPGRIFNYSRDCFACYVRMQASFAAEDGFEDLSRQMLDHIGEESMQCAA